MIYNGSVEQWEKVGMLEHFNEQQKKEFTFFLHNMLNFVTNFKDIMMDEDFKKEIQNSEYSKDEIHTVGVVAIFPILHKLYKANKLSYFDFIEKCEKHSVAFISVVKQLDDIKALSIYPVGLFSDYVNSFMSKLFFDYVRWYLKNGKEILSQHDGFNHIDREAEMIDQYSKNIDIEEVHIYAQNALNEIRITLPSLIK